MLVDRKSLAILPKKRQAKLLHVMRAYKLIDICELWHIAAGSRRCSRVMQA